MNKVKISIVGFVMVFSLFGTSCGNPISKEKKEVVADTIPTVIKNDTLSKIYQYQIADTFENGEPLKVQYVDKQDTSKIVYEKQFYKSGKIFIEGALDNGIRTGKWIAWYENGLIWSIGYYKEGLKDGNSEVYYENGQLRYNKNYELDVAVGSWKFYDTLGVLLSEVMYDNGKKLWQKGNTPGDTQK
jgi:antitoxin component YwqK of YwqJK toxin-antitoxin module